MNQKYRLRSKAPQRARFPRLFLDSPQSTCAKYFSESDANQNITRCYYETRRRKKTSNKSHASNEFSFRQLVINCPTSTHMRLSVGFTISRKTANIFSR